MLNITQIADYSEALKAWGFKPFNFSFNRFPSYVANFYSDQDKEQLVFTTYIFIDPEIIWEINMRVTDMLLRDKVIQIKIKYAEDLPTIENTIKYVWDIYNKLNPTALKSDVVMEEVIF